MPNNLSRKIRFFDNFNLYGSCHDLHHYQIGIGFLLFHVQFTPGHLVNAVILYGLPESLEDAALIDGATIPQAFLKIILPITGPGLVSTGILTVIISWNEFIFAC